MPQYRKWAARIPRGTISLIEIKIAAALHDYKNWDIALSIEREVFELVIRGKTNKQVANALGASGCTIKAHRQRVRKCKSGP